MDHAYLFNDRSTLYLNVTNRCTNRCEFCVRNRCSGLGGSVLRGDDEPDLDALLAAIDEHGGASAFEEIVWCGFGEPTFRLDLILAASPLFRDAGCEVRLNTNGHANLIHGQDVLPELAGVLDTVSVSLNAPNSERYLELCRPDVDMLDADIPLERFWDAMIGFLSDASRLVPRVAASVVGSTLDDDEIEACEELARSLGARVFRVR
jgi:TatD DNase family protein